MYHILVKDDYTIYRKGINEIIRTKYPYSNITEVDSSVNLAAKASQQNWDIIIFDVTDSSVKNFHLLSALKQTCPGTRLIVTTSVENFLLKNALISAGAYACITKDCSTENFIKAIDRAMQNNQALV
ncbi:MAG: response regulator transcription factor [Chitinophagaceae bacterium]|nr:response regulator transcription factor [Chitinophagaceae bacterium]